MSWANAIHQPAPVVLELPPLYAHQAHDVDRYLENFSLCNFSDPGTGKTRTLIEAICRLGGRALVLAPKSILQASWGNDIHRFAPGTEDAVARAEDREAQFKRDVPFVITNHDAVTWLYQNKKYARGFTHLIIDESTAYKNPQAIRSRRVRELRETIPHATILTGTPNPQGVLDMWHQVLLVDKGERLGGHYYKFRHAVCEPKMRRPGSTFVEWKEKDGALDVVTSLIADITIRNDRRDCLDLPHNQQILTNVTLSAKHRRLYEQLKRQALLELDSGTVSAINAVSLLAKLLQLTSGAVYNEDGTSSVVDGDRYDLVMELVEQRRHSVVAFNWRHQRDELVRRAQQAKISYGVIDGSVSATKRTQAVDDFQAGKLRVLFCHPASAGHGLTLTRAATTIWSSPTYNLEHWVQFNARIDRAGQTQEMETIMIQAEDTVETEVYTRLREKDTNMADLLGLLR
jgi:SNF2 family DNA or RNA helicase